MSNKKNIIIALITVMIVVGAFAVYKIYYQKAEVVSNDFFSIQDDANSIVWNEQTNVDELSRGEFNRKIEELKNKIATETDSENLMAHYTNIGIYYGYLGDYRSAYDYYLKALEIDPSFRRSWLNLGDILVNMKAYQSAEAAYKKSIDLFAYDDLGYKKLTSLYELAYAGNHDLIKSTYEQGLDVLRGNSEDEVPLLKQYANWLVETKQTVDAEKIYDELIEKDPDNAKIYQNYQNNL